MSYTVNQYDVAGVLRTYSEIASHARDTEHLHDIIYRIKHDKDLDCRRVKCEKMKE